MKEEPPFLLAPMERLVWALRRGGSE